MLATIVLSTFQKFRRDRGSVIALIFAICLLPLVLLIALAIDFSFFTEARSQVQLAADAAATHAIRAATGTYALETIDGIALVTAQADAIAAGEEAGNAWFAAQLGQLPTAYVTIVPTTATNAGNPAVVVKATSNPSGFSATVAYLGEYPPFFDHLFGTTTNWNITGSSGAAAQYSYVEILMMLDTSQSMQIAADATDIATMNENTVCIPASELSVTLGMNGMQRYTPYGTDPSTAFSLTNAVGYVAGTGATNGTCSSKYTQISDPIPDDTNKYPTPNPPQTPCAFACHTTTTLAPDGYKTPSGYPVTSDLYGLARRLGVNLRIDEVFKAAENVVQSMIYTEQASNQFAVGIYQFNDDISGGTDYAGNKIAGIAAGTGVPPAIGGTGNYEATYDLATALKDLDAIDYNQTPAETSFPPIVTLNSGNDEINNHTDFQKSATDFLAGTATSGVALSTTPAAGTPGQTQANPVKDIFLVTDGLDDISDYANTGHTARAMGEMTSAVSETGQTNAAICQLFKNRGFKVYVLYITYYGVPLQFYTEINTPAAYAYTGIQATTGTKNDYPSIASAQNVQAYVEGQQATNLIGPQSVSVSAPVTAVNPAPDTAALTACASPGDLYTATDSADINKQLSAMLASALSGAIQITN